MSRWKNSFSNPSICIIVLGCVISALIRGGMDCIISSRATNPEWSTQSEVIASVASTNVSAIQLDRWEREEPRNDEGPPSISIRARIL